jgi:hypothetical protein
LFIGFRRRKELFTDLFFRGNFPFGTPIEPKGSGGQITLMISDNIISGLKGTAGISRLLKRAFFLGASPETVRRTLRAESLTQLPHSGERNALFIGVLIFFSHYFPPAAKS